jgi:hypothetical protein
MSRLLALILIVHVLAADIGRGFDLHGNAGCADAAATLADSAPSEAQSNSGSDGAPAGAHEGEHSFGCDPC